MLALLGQLSGVTAVAETGDGREALGVLATDLVATQSLPDECTGRAGSRDEDRRAPERRQCFPRARPIARRRTDESRSLRATFHEPAVAAPRSQLRPGTTLN